MIILKRIIGWETPSDKPKFSDIEFFRPKKCPCCGKARENGILWIIGHGTYERWAYIPQGIKVRIRRFLCKSCGKTTSVLPDWLLPRFQYAAPLILSSLKQYYVDGKKAAEATGNLLIHPGKQSWGLLYRWGAGFLMHVMLWGWLGYRLGVRKETKWSRDRVGIHLERFFRNFNGRVMPNERPTMDQIIQLSLAGMVFDRKKAWSSLHGTHGDQFPLSPQKMRFAPPTHNEGRSRAPP